MFSDEDEQILTDRNHHPFNFLAEKVETKAHTYSDRVILRAMGHHSMEEYRRMAEKGCFWLAQKRDESEEATD